MSAPAQPRSDLPTRPTMFHREGVFYVVETYEDDDYGKLAEHAALNPGTLKITHAITGETLWEPAQ